VFWGSMAYVLIGGTAIGTVLTLAFLPALYAIWFRVSHVDAVHHRCSSRAGEPVHSIRRDCRLRFDSHLREGIRIDPKVALQNRTHAHGQRFHYDQ